MRLLAPNEGISDEIIGFHAQQAVEKWLKAVLGSRGTEFEYTHDRRRLIAEVTAAVGEFPFDNSEVIALTEHAVPLRYDEILDSGKGGRWLESSRGVARRLIPTQGLAALFATRNVATAWTSSLESVWP